MQTFTQEPTKDAIERVVTGDRYFNDYPTNRSVANIPSEGNKDYLFLQTVLLSNDLRDKKISIEEAEKLFDDIDYLHTNLMAISFSYKIIRSAAEFDKALKLIEEKRALEELVRAAENRFKEYIISLSDSELDSWFDHYYDGE